MHKEVSVSEQIISIAFTCNADKSAHDKTIHLDQNLGAGTVTLGARYKNADPSHLYSIEMDPADLQRFGNLCVFLGKMLEENEP
jgi:hypothetical protein